MNKKYFNIHSLKIAFILEKILKNENLEYNNKVYFYDEKINLIFFFL